jgi:hypothetical protein
MMGQVAVLLEERRPPGWPAKVHRARKALIDQNHAVVDLGALPLVGGGRGVRGSASGVIIIIIIINNNNNTLRIQSAVWW